MARDYRALFDSIDEGFCIIDVMFDASGKAVDYRFCEVNQTFERQTGLVNAAGRTAREMVPGLEARWFDTYGDVVVTRQAKRFVEGSEVMRHWFDVYAFPLGPEGSKEVAIVFKDITSEQLALRELRENDRLKDEFLAMLAHELRNPMVPIQAALYQLRQSTDAETVRRAADVIDRQMGQLVRLVDDLMEVSRVTRGKVALRSEPIELQYALHGAIEAVEPMLKKAGIRLAADLPDAPIIVDGDAVRLTQVFTNLLANAIKYSPAGSNVGLTTSSEKDEVLVTVIDDGIGLPTDRLEHIFDMFAQLGPRGTSVQGGLGIGLTLVRTLVEMHGGSVEAHSEGLGRGSRFVVRLPHRRDESPLEAAEVHDTPLCKLDGLRVMVVDDNREIVESFADWLQAQGAVVRVCQDGHEALEAATLWHPHVVMLDLGLSGLDGWEVARRLRADPEGLSRLLIAISGWGQPADIERSRRAGFDDHFTKPPPLARLQAVLCEHRDHVFPAAD
ncbi:two-component system, chemotaxis family, CheB/CheR fusion protein [Solilutibacter tolerans]|uniref:histidine kinase n=1 Tax=Solilutibacter tolerans TaxID=1604334 RepID=A0A1N6P6C6_9GAMM|nr:two-component system, chemotaxis family, CheB/CheR fusion protein [Lysobacter tolerans]